MDQTEGLTKRQRAAALKQLMNFEGWEIVRGMMEEGVNANFQDLINTSPGDDAVVLARHSVSYAVKKFVESIFGRIKQEIIEGQQEEASSETAEPPLLLDL